MGFTKEVVQQMSPEEEEEARMLAMRLVTGSCLSMILNVAIELELLEIIVKAGPGAKLSPDDIATQLPTENPQAADMLDRILRLLAANGVVSCSVESGDDGRPSCKYGATPVCKYLTKNEDGVSMAAFCLLVHDKVTMESWYYMKDAVLEGGIPFKKAHGMTAFEHHGSDPRFNKLFNDSMRNHSTILIKQLLETYRGFDDVKVLVDVGGGTGATLHMITSRHPHIKGINFDLPLVIASAPTNPGVEHVSGDMFESIPGGGDAIFMKWILHDWTDEQCARILKNCWKALPEEGKVIVVEYLLPVIPEPDSRSQGIFPLDIGMMIHTGGRERTQEEFEAMAKEAGFTGFKATYVSLYSWVMEFTK
ncbi:hypothetical protein C4D60_Mb02t06320 [Musa balbisiana]|uniref:O-methyltransferase domain-containing protein n=1 Tax=Musa balbisiana TaxID=52838 RepID=A0A4S8IA23_MUSBA|nr:hypothetical protein C4D60_Mb02t06320 [Musa balbisiana]